MVFLRGLSRAPASKSGQSGVCGEPDHRAVGPRRRFVVYLEGRFIFSDKARAEKRTRD
jgi:hypothetical protein